MIHTLSSEVCLYAWQRYLAKDKVNDTKLCNHKILVLHLLVRSTCDLTPLDIADIGDKLDDHPIQGCEPATMTTDLAAPVKKLTQTWSRGAKLAKKFGKAASAEHDGDVEELRKEVESLQQALEGDSKDVEAEYRKCEEAHQDSFAKSLEEDCKCLWKHANKARC